MSLTVRTYPVSEILGNQEGTLWSGIFVFPKERAQEVSEAIENVVNNSDYYTDGLLMIAALPPAFKPAAVVSTKLIGRNDDSLHLKAFKPLYNLNPMIFNENLVHIENNGDATQALCVPGDFKKLRLTGIHSYNPEHFPQLVKLWQDLTTSCPEATGSIFSIQWSSSPAQKPNFESANSMHSTRLWANNMIWCKDNAGAGTAQSYLERVIAVTRGDQKEHEYVDFANSLREPESPVERRYKGKDRLERLKTLKKKWDPEGRFGKELL